MEEELRAMLRAETAVAALVGARVYWGERPQGDPLPAVVLTVVDDREGSTLSGGDGLFLGMVQADCYALDLGAAKRLG
ncbi:tail completion protein gp17 [Salipiger sp.]|uniref:tail completion protein gp17 n=1 Tax=Salipiger sp. TaxID=2078585 RepID=UPI003A96D84E